MIHKLKLLENFTKNNKSEIVTSNKLLIRFLKTKFSSKVHFILTDIYLF